MGDTGTHAFLAKVTAGELDVYVVKTVQVGEENLGRGGRERGVRGWKRGGGGARGDAVPF